MSLKDKYQVKNVWISAVTPDNISRMSALSWVNDSIQCQLNKIEEMSTGAAYCALTDKLFPGSVPLRKVKWNSRSDVDWLVNWRILQKAWGDLGIDKPINVQTLMRAKFQDNFEFLVWFKKFYDNNDAGYDYDPLAARGGEQFPVSTGRAGARAPPARSAPLHPTPETRRATAAPPARTAPSRPAASARPATSSSARPARPSESEAALRAKIEEQQTMISTFEKELEELTGERDFYYNRLRAVENLCYELGDDSQISVKKVLAVLYEKDGDADVDEFARLESEVTHDLAEQSLDRQSNATETLDRAPSAAALSEQHEAVDANESNYLDTTETLPHNDVADLGAAENVKPAEPAVVANGTKNGAHVAPVDEPEEF